MIYIIIKKRKGISTIVATVLIVVITVSAAGMIFSWMSGITSTTTNRASNHTERILGCAGASIQIRDVYLKNSTSQATVKAIVENTGLSNNLVIYDGQVYSSNGTNYSANNLPVSLNPGEIAILEFSTQIPVCANFSYAMVDTRCDDISAEFHGTPKCT